MTNKEFAFLQFSLVPLYAVPVLGSIYGRGLENFMVPLALVTFAWALAMIGIVVAVAVRVPARKIAASGSSTALGAEGGIGSGI